MTAFQKSLLAIAFASFVCLAIATNSIVSANNDRKPLSQHDAIVKLQKAQAEQFKGHSK